MKKQVFLLLIMSFVLMNGSFTQASASKSSPDFIEISSIPDGFEKIDLHGCLMLGISPNAIEAGASDDAVYIQFNQSFGNVSIAIYNSNNLVVYSTIIDTSIQQVVIIPFTTAATDSYTIVLDNTTSYAEGDFDKN